MAQKFRSIVIKGKTFAVSLSDSGDFFTDVDGDQVRSESLKELKSKLAKIMLRSTRVSIPFCRWESACWNEKGPGKLRTGVIVGIHASNNNLLLRFNGEKGSIQDRGYSLSSFFEPKDGEQLQRLQLAAFAANEALKAFTTKYAFTGIVRVEEALGEKPEEN